MPETARSADVAVLLPVTQAARDALPRDGRPLTRDALAARQQGHPIGNARLTLLLHATRREPTS